MVGATTEVLEVALRMYRGLLSESTSAAFGPVPFASTAFCLADPPPGSGAPALPGEGCLPAVPDDGEDL
eukprot:2646994-Alexandrium_andersonii.AAC.1